MGMGHTSVKETKVEKNILVEQWQRPEAGVNVNQEELAKNYFLLK